MYNITEKMAANHYRHILLCWNDFKADEFSNALNDEIVFKEDVGCLGKTIFIGKIHNKLLSFSFIQKNIFS